MSPGRGDTAVLGVQKWGEKELGGAQLCRGYSRELDLMTRVA